MAAPNAPAAEVAPVPARQHEGLILLGLALGILLAALDQTVVATSLGTIVVELGGFEHASWLFAAYMLASVVVIPVAGKLSDLLGPRPVFLAGMAVFLLGSALCGTATSMTQLILYRGVQGLGGGVLFPVALATVAKLYPPSERGRIGGAFAATFGLSSVIGPFLGGWIVDYVHLWGIASWRWVFYVNLPVGAFAIAVVALYFPRLAAAPAPRIDYAGIVTLTTGLVSALLITVWGGEAYPWLSAPILGLAAVSVLALAAFVRIETRAKDPILPLTLFHEPIFLVSAIASVFLGAAMFGVITFMPTFMQGVIGMSATYSGAVLTPLTLGIVFGSIVSGRLVNRTGYKVFTLAGPLLTAAGFLLLMTLDRHAAVWAAVVAMVVIGLGLGFTIQIYVLAVQNVVSRRLTGVATSSLVLFRTLGATFGVTVLGVLLRNRLQGELPARVQPDALAAILQRPDVAGKLARVPQVLLDPASVAALPAGVVDGIRDAYTSGIGLVALVGAAVCVAAFAVSLFLRDVPIKSKAEYAAETAREAEPATAR